MRLIFVVATLFLFVGLGHSQSNSRGSCPRGKGGIGLCVFNPEINCTGDEECEVKVRGQLCCPSGCNRVCMNPIPPQDNNHMDVCPPTGIPPSFGTCVFDAKINCLENSDCSSGKVCCAQGCNKVCKDPLPRPSSSGQGQPQPQRPQILPPVTSDDLSDDLCPPSPSSIVGTCVFNPSLNCESSSNCTNGQICCRDGCGKICKTPKNSRASGSCPVSSASKPGIIAGVCSFDPKKNCSVDEDCKNGKICCSSGSGACGKECVNPSPVEVHPATRP